MVRRLEVVSFLVLIACGVMFSVDWIGRRWPESIDPVPLSGTTLGDMTAKLALVEFSDFECRFCRDFHDRTWPELERRFVRTGLVRYVFKHFPSPSRPVAGEEARRLACVPAAKYWEVHRELFVRPPEPGYGHEIATSLGLDTQALAHCMSGVGASTVDLDVSDGVAWGVNSTPTFFIGVPDNAGRFTPLERIVGAQHVQVFRQSLDHHLSDYR